MKGQEFANEQVDGLSYPQHVATVGFVAVVHDRDTCN